MTLRIDPALFEENAASTETIAFNEDVIALLKDAPDMWSVPASEIRRARMEGKGPFPLEPLEPSAETVSIETTAGPLELRVFQPNSNKPAGTYFHIHGGGWVVGSSQAQDVRLQEIADKCSLTCISVEYRLAPENPYPAGPDDCESAALWLLDGKHGYNTRFLAIGGESAGANLAVVTLLRLRDRLGKCPFHAANLTAGVYDLGQTASARNWGTEKLILNSRDMRMFASRYVQGITDYRNADVSPLFAKLNGLPQALFSVGTRDLLLDDSLQMATLWHAANGNAQIDVTPGGCHVFQSFRHLAIAQQSNAKIDAFLNRARGLLG